MQAAASILRISSKNKRNIKTRPLEYLLASDCDMRRKTQRATWNAFCTLFRRVQFCELFACSQPETKQEIKYTTREGHKHTSPLCIFLAMLEIFSMKRQSSEISTECKRNLKTKTKTKKTTTTTFKRKKYEIKLEMDCYDCVCWDPTL